MPARPTLVSAVALAATVGLVAPAQAAQPLLRETIAGPYEFLDCDDRYLVEGTFTQRLLIRDTNPSVAGEFFKLSNRYTFSEVITNLATGEHVTAAAHGHYIELQPRTTDGRIFDFITHDTGAFVLRSSSGEVVLREAGLLQFSFRFDSLGDGQPGGEFLSYETDLRTAGQHPTFEDDFDFCGLLDDLTG